MSLLIKNAIIVNADDHSKTKKDIFINKGVIEKIGKNLTEKANETVDAKGMLVMPGLIDIHIHMREPGREDKETIESGSRAAVKGGFTTVMCMPNTNPVIDNPLVVKSIITEAKRVGLCDVIPIGAISRGQKDEELVDMMEMREAGCLALSDDGKSVVNSQLMRLALEYGKMANLLMIQHCEEPFLSRDGVMNEGANSTLFGLKGQAGVAETAIVARDIELAHYLGTTVHFAHMSLRRSVELIRMAKQQGIPVTAEACPHHFALTDDALKDYDTNAKVNPPLRTQDDVEAIKEGIKDGTIDCIVTDHAPHTTEDKEVDMDHAPFGMIGLETSVGLTITELVKPGVISFADMADKMSTAPARIVGLKDRGVIKEGYKADITIIDPDKQWIVKKDEFASKSRNSPFIGKKLTGKVSVTIFDGKVVYKA